MRVTLFLLFIFLSTQSCSETDSEYSNSLPLHEEQSSGAPVLITKNRVKETLRNELSMRLGRNVNIKIDDIRETENWIFICGQPLELDGNPLDYSTTSLKSDSAQGLIDDYYCALVNKLSPVLRVQELSVGTTDMPMFDWIEKYSLPESLLTSPDDK